MVTSGNLNAKCREVCIKAKSPTALLSIVGQVTKHTTLEWLTCIDNCWIVENTHFVCCEPTL